LQLLLASAAAHRTHAIAHIKYWQTTETHQAETDIHHNGGAAVHVGKAAADPINSQSTHHGSKDHARDQANNTLISMSALK
jgi:hypothetical protein